MSGGTPQNQQPSQQQTSQAAHQYGLHQGYQNYQTQQQVDTQADQQVRSGGLWAPILKSLGEAQATSQFNNKLPGEINNLKQGMLIRSAPSFSAPNYLSFSHQQLYQMVTGGVNPSRVGEVGDTWIQMGNDLTSFQTDFAKALASSETTWTGANADAARKSVAELGNAGGQIGQAAQLAGMVTHQQSLALSVAKNSVPPPPSPPYNPQAAQQQLQTITNPVDLAKQAAADQAAATAQAQAHQQAAQVVREYDTTVAQTSATMPAFAPAPRVVHVTSGPGPTTVHQPPPSQGLPGPGQVGPRGLPSPGPTSRPPAPSTGSWPGQSGVPSTPGVPGVPGQSGQPGTDPGQSTGTSGYTDPGQVGGGQGEPVPGGDLPGGTGGGAADLLGGGMIGPMGGTGGLTGLGEDALRGGSGFGPGAGGLSGGGFGGGAGGFGSGGTSAFGPGGARSGAGAAAGAAAAEEAAIESGAAGARGAAGSPGGMMPGGQGGRRSEDAEHHRASYLVEPDANELFGSDAQTVPPVIGGD